ncbi:hypothetical protein T492DRAFT_850032 [Pavlovales sp. CCMP2436]|nr:hypothetical protein T492DRAFT_850032 [Pavlovales sp. CCMP2436]
MLNLARWRVAFKIRWYGYCGMRDSGKGTETVKTKDSATTDPAKALGWIVDKKNCRIIISNEIPGDEHNVLNGGLIKILAYDGDEVEARKLYKDASGFTPQFTIFLCYNNLHPCELANATENLEQFDYKNKFVETEDLIADCLLLKQKDPNIKKLVAEDRIIDAYILYILNAFKQTREKAPQSILDANMTTKGEEPESMLNYVIKHFKTTQLDEKRLHIKECWYR